MAIARSDNAKPMMPKRFQSEHPGAPQRAPFRIAIVGGGLAGALTAIQLLRTANVPTQITVFDPNPELGRGIAYGTPDFSLTLNGPAKSFGLRPGDPLHFARWLKTATANAGRPSYPDAATAFAPRWVFGDYVRAELAEALAQARPGVRFLHIASDVVALRQVVRGDNPEFALTTRAGDVAIADHVVLALGKFPSAAATPSLGWRYLPSPWDGEALDAVAGQDDLLLIGSSLTMIDAVAALEKKGFRGRYHILSRRGLTPEARRETEPWPEFLDPAALPRTAREALACVRAQIRRAREQGDDWQRVVLAVRPHLGAIWAGATDAERRRFLRQVRPWWDLFLHRAPPDGAAALAAAREQGRVIPHRGALLGLAAIRNAHGDRILARYAPRDVVAGTPSRSLAVGAAIHCGGFDFRWNASSLRAGQAGQWLAASLLEHGLVCPSVLGAGIQAAPASLAVIDADGEVSSGLSATGAALRAALLESSTIGELLKQAIVLADRLTGDAQARGNLRQAA